MEKLQSSIDRDNSYVDELTTYSTDLIKKLVESTTITLGELKELANSLRAAYADCIEIDAIVEPGSSGQATRIISHLLSVVESTIYRRR